MAFVTFSSVECSGQSDLCLCSKGKLVYGNYGRQEDLDVLQKKNVELKGSVLLLRTGKISFAEQVCAGLTPSRTSCHPFSVQELH